MADHHKTHSCPRGADLQGIRDGLLHCANCGTIFVPGDSWLLAEQLFNRLRRRAARAKGFIPAEWSELHRYLQVGARDPVKQCTSPSQPRSWPEARPK